MKETRGRRFDDQRGCADHRRLDGGRCRTGRCRAGSPPRENVC